MLADLQRRPDLARLVSQVDVSNVRDAVVLLKDDTALIHTGDDHFVDRVQTYLDIAARLRENVPQIDSVDVRFGDTRVREAAGHSGKCRRKHSREAQWHAESDTWLDSTSAPRPSSASSARRWTMAASTIVGIGVAESRGIKRGVVVNLEGAVESIKKAIEEAELMAGIEIDSVHLALSGPHVKGFNSRGVIAVAGKNREITRDDVRRAIDAAKAVALPTGREILHVLPQDFVVDEQDGIGAPVGHDRRQARGQRARRDRRRCRPRRTSSRA